MDGVVEGVVEGVEVFEAGLLESVVNCLEWAGGGGVCVKLRGSSFVNEAKRSPFDETERGNGNYIKQ